MQFHFEFITSHKQDFKYYKHQLIDLTSEQIIKRILASYAVIKPYHELLNCEIVQFFNYDYWNLLPDNWAKYLMELNIEQLAYFMKANQKGLPIMPESLYNVRELITNLCLDQIDLIYHTHSLVNRENEETFDQFQSLYQDQVKKLPFYDNFINFDKKKVPLNSLRYKCKDKKLAEIVVMSDLCFKAFLKKKVDFIVDIGAGLGHLSRCLAFIYNIDVITIEKEEKMTEEALRLDQKFLKLIRNECKRNPNVGQLNFGKIYRISAEIVPGMSADQFLDLVKSHVDLQHYSSSTKFGLVGLHPCGDLAGTMLHLYKNCSNCQFINLASCCYNKMNIDAETTKSKKFIGYPMNIYTSSISLGRNELGLALHALESHKERFINEPETFKADFYRALVEKFIQQLAPEYAEKRRRNVKTVGNAAASSFEEYLKQSIEGVVIDERINNALKSIDETIEYHKILAFSSLRHLFAPLLETIVLLDRLLFLKTVSDDCYIAQRFHPRISPRVHVLTAFKVIS